MKKTKLVPAILYKSELERLFAERIYSDEFFYYSGETYDHEVPEIKTESNRFQWAIIFDDKVTGYMAYHVDPSTSTVWSFGIYSFDPGSGIPTAKIIFEKMEELVAQYRRIEWRMIGGNWVEADYDRFCEAHNGEKHILHDVVKDQYGKYHDEMIYEIVRKD
jgi:hypothetical protein